MLSFYRTDASPDLCNKAPRRLKNWLAPDSRFIVLRDQDSGNCIAIKQELQRICLAAGKPDALVRIACHELESFYLGDLAAVEIALSISGLARQQGTAKYRSPDQLANAAEELKKITKGRYQKVLGSRSIAPHLRLDGSNTSISFRALIAGINKQVNLAN